MSIGQALRINKEAEDPSSKYFPWLFLLFLINSKITVFRIRVEKWRKFLWLRWKYIILKIGNRIFDDSLIYFKKILNSTFQSKFQKCLIFLLPRLLSRRLDIKTPWKFRNARLASRFFRPVVYNPYWSTTRVLSKLAKSCVQRNHVKCLKAVFGSKDCEFESQTINLFLVSLNPVGSFLSI